MKNYFLCYLAIATLLSFISCSQDDPAEEDVRKEVKVTATFKGLSAARNATTRVTDNSWENVDEIGLFMMKSGVALDQDALANNVKYTFDSGEIFNNASENKIYFPFNKEKVDFIFNTPNSNSLPGNLKMGWKEYGKTGLKVRINNIANSLYYRAAKKEFDVDEIDKVHYVKNLSKEYLHMFLSKLITDDQVLRKNISSDYFIWRYLDVPTHKYGVFIDSQDRFLIFFRLNKKSVS